jgi:hypothetical protein
VAHVVDSLPVTLCLLRPWESYLDICAKVVGGLLIALTSVDSHV